MSVVRLNQQPTLENTLQDESAVSYQPIYASAKVLCRLFGISDTTLWRLCKKAREEEQDNFSIRVSANKVLYHIKGFEEYLQSINAKYL